MKHLAFLLAVLCAGCATTVVHAEPLPLPAVDFLVEGTLTRGGVETPMTMRHRNGRMRVDATMDGAEATVHFDRAKRNAIVVMQRAGRTFAMEIDPTTVGGAVTAWEVEATRLGADRIAGEECVDYEFERTVGATLRACMTVDGVPLRTIELSGERATWVAARATRAAQHPSWFVVPADAVRMPTLPFAPRR